CGEVRRQGRLHLDVSAGERMREGEACRVQELPLQAELARPPVDGIARDGEIDRGQVHTDLMRPPRLEADVEEGVPPQRLDELKMGHRVARSIRIEGMPRR